MWIYLPKQLTLEFSKLLKLLLIVSVCFFFFFSSLFHLMFMYMYVHTHADLQQHNPVITSTTIATVRRAARPPATAA